MLCNKQVPANPSRAQALLDWYDRHARALPWRAPRGEPSDPYAVWLSEIMLQQTTVVAVKPYFEKFLARWPRVEDLAAAPVEAVMQAWAGLGYYSRARNLHACAITVAREYGGAFPADETALLKLPGIGPYTAAAIAAIAFGRRAAVVDGNVERVVTRLFAIAQIMPKAKILVRAEVERMAPDTRPGDFAQAMMDLGATICTPRNPACALCPLMQTCAARASAQMERYPVKAPKVARPRRTGEAFYAEREDGFVLVRTRPAKGLLGGMTEIPGAEWRKAGVEPTPISPPFDLRPGAAREKPKWRKLDGFVEHVFTHFSLQLDVFVTKVPVDASTPEDHRWVALHALDEEAFPSVMRKVIAHARNDRAK